MPHTPLHIVSFDRPYPPIYGGAIDVFYKLKALHAAGFEIHFHCFSDYAPDDSALLPYAKEVHFYARRKTGSRLLSRSPFSVASRYQPELAERLKALEAPILFEGLQSTYVLRKHDFGDRPIFLRLMNLESLYFMGLSRSERNWGKKLAFALEAFKYRFYQSIIKRFDRVFTLSVHETAQVQKRFGNAVYVPVFHGHQAPASLHGVGKYALYHGDLRLSDNRRAAKFLIDVFKSIPDFELVIACTRGKRFVKRHSKGMPNVRQVTIHDGDHLERLLHEAQMSVMVSFQQSGTKLKAVNSLYQSRHCVINSNMVDDPALRSLCTMAETCEQFVDAVNRLKSLPYTDAGKREEILGKILDDAVNAQLIVRAITGS